MIERLNPAAQRWMHAPETRSVLQVLTAEGGTARFVGGCVRNALLGREIDDIDIATPLLPAEVTRRLEAAGLKAIPTGIEHGTVTAIAGGKPYEITTLRRDVSTDGRRAVVAFTQDWQEDALRRDFTMNALYADETGTIYDYAGGVADLRAGRVRFAGDPATRIHEDYLRILRLFRFHAWYGRGDMDSAALQAVARAAAHDKAAFDLNVAGERIQKEMIKLLAAEDPIPALRVMAAVGALTLMLPIGLQFGRFERLVHIDAVNFFKPDPLLRLTSLLPDDVAEAEYVAEDWSLSNAQRARLTDLAGGREKIVSYMSIREMRKLLYRLGTQRFRDRVLLRWAEDAKPSNGIAWRALLAMGDSWQRPQFPLTGRDVMAAGVAEGPQIGRILSEVEEWWIDADFIDDEFSLAERLKAVVQAVI